MDDAAPIAAISTPPGLGGIGVIRISGEGALAIGDRLAGPSAKRPSRVPANTFFHAPVIHPVSGKKIDDALFLIFHAPHSYTGEETLEIQGHGGAQQPQRILEAVLAAGARLARAGEFSQRAFLNGRMDLTQAEAVCDLIHAKSERAAQSARAQLDGALGEAFRGVYEELVNLSADVEHLLDFDEGELPDDFLEQARHRLGGVLRQVNRLAETRQEGQLLREGALVVISGKPNAGKSSLMNALLRQNRAIVNARPGTTRDAIEESCLLQGIAVRLVDTAGLRETEDEIEREGIDRARQWIRQADLNLYLIDQTQPESVPMDHFPDPSRLLVVYTKRDLMPRIEWPALSISAETGEGMPELKAEMIKKLGLSQATGGGAAAISLRHAEELSLACEQCGKADMQLALGAAGLVFSAMHLKAACEAIGRSLGRVYSDDLLDRVFSRFCVGK